MRIDIYTNSDSHDCETCGASWAQGGKVFIDGKLIVDLPAVAHCYGASSYNEDELLVIALKEIGVNVFVDGDNYHVTCHNDYYHGKSK